MTEEEIRLISKIASDRKFAIKNVDAIYSQDAVEKMKTFVRSYRFLFHLQNNIKEKEIRDKISKQDFKGLYHFNKGILVTKSTLIKGEKYSAIPIHLLLAII